MTITEQPTANGKYSAYFPIKFEATDTSNPDYLYFLVRNEDGSLIDGVPYYKAANIDNVFYFDASSYIKALFNVRSVDGLSLYDIDVLDDAFGNFEVIVNDEANTSGATVSNSFYAFAMIDNKRYLNDQTANYGLSSKQLLFSNDFTNSLIPNRKIGKYDRVNLFAEYDYLYLFGYGVENPTSSSMVFAALKLDLAAYQNELISIPLNKDFVNANFEPITAGTTALPYKSFRISLSSLNKVTDSVLFKPNNDCNVLEFCYVNRYGVKENIFFKSADNKSLKIESDIYMTAGYAHTGYENTFHTSADSQKINQDIEIIQEVQGEKMLRKYENQLIDFLTSPTVWFVPSDLEIQRVNIYDGTYNITENGRGLEISFKYAVAQKRKTFI